MTDSSIDKNLPEAPCYHPATIISGRDVVPGETKLWCTCGLSKKQPWCDFSHLKAKTSFRPIKWTVPENQKIFSICQCKYTKGPPLCDGAHNYPRNCVPSKFSEKMRKKCCKDIEDLCKNIEKL